jgi:hypothetical protein
MCWSTGKLSSCRYIFYRHRKTSEEKKVLMAFTVSPNFLLDNAAPVFPEQLETTIAKRWSCAPAHKRSLAATRMADHHYLFCVNILLHFEIVELHGWQPMPMRRWLSFHIRILSGRG